MAIFSTKIHAGLSLSVSADVSDYPAPWTVQAFLRGPSVINLTASGGTFTADATATAAWTPGHYWYEVRAIKGNDAVLLDSGELDILPNIAAAGASFDGRSPNKIAYDSICAVLARRATQDQQRYIINNRELWRTPIHELLKLKAHYLALVQAETRKSGTFGRRINITFNSP